jgi:hypothetical protein
VAGKAPGLESCPRRHTGTLGRRAGGCFGAGIFIVERGLPRLTEQCKKNFAEKMRNAKWPLDVSPETSYSQNVDLE